MFGKKNLDPLKAILTKAWLELGNLGLFYDPRTTVYNLLYFSLYLYQAILKQYTNVKNMVNI